MSFWSAFSSASKEAPKPEGVCPGLSIFVSSSCGPGSRLARLLTASTAAPPTQVPRARPCHPSQRRWDRASPCRSATPLWRTHTIMKAPQTWTCTGPSAPVMSACGAGRQRQVCAAGSDQQRCCWCSDDPVAATLLQQTNPYTQLASAARSSLHPRGRELSRLDTVLLWPTTGLPFACPAAPAAAAALLASDLVQTTAQGTAKASGASCSAATAPKHHPEQHSTARSMTCSWALGLARPQQNCSHSSSQRCSAR